MLWIAGEDMVIFILIRSLRGAVAKKCNGSFGRKRKMIMQYVQKKRTEI